MKITKGDPAYLQAALAAWTSYIGWNPDKPPCVAADEAIRHANAFAERFNREMATVVENEAFVIQG